MPTYSYKCEACGNAEDARRPVAERNDVSMCKVCDEGYMMRQATAPTFIINGYNAKNGYTKND